LSKDKKTISPISCKTEPLSTIYDNIREFARLREIPFSLAVRKFLIAGNAAMKRTFKFRKVKDEKNKP
jgi:hypothetical protein